MPHVDWDEDYEVPHLLGLLRYYMVGKSSSKLNVSDSDLEKMESIATSAGAVELAEMGIFLTAKNTTKLPDMGLDRKWIIFNELSMAAAVPQRCARKLARQHGGPGAVHHPGFPGSSGETCGLCCLLLPHPPMHADAQGGGRA